MICGWYGVGAHGECLHLDSVPALTADAVKGIPPQNMAPLLQSNYPTHLLYTIALGFVKTSILFSTCASITANTHDGRSTSSWPSLLSYPLQRFFSCFRLCPAFLVLGSRGTNGSSREMLESTHTADVLQPQRHLHIVQDVSIYLLSIPTLWNLQIPRRQKLALGALFSVGLVAVAGKRRRPRNLAVH
jgi:hypothetical protein